MKFILRKVSNLTILTVLFSVSFLHAQISTSGTGLRNIGPDNAGEAKVSQITSDAGIYFNQGLLNLQDNRRTQARVDFDKSVEVFLMSNVNVKSNEKLKNCYSQLIETVFRMEFPSAQLPQIKGLSVTCGWNIDGQLADSVAKLSIASPNGILNASADNALIRSAGTMGGQGDFQQVGFSDQKFEPSPLDELSKLELTPEEINVVNTPEGREEYVLIERAIANKSLGFKFTMHPKVQQFLSYYRGRGRQTMEIGLMRSGQFVRMARQIFREEGIPENIVWLGQVESAWKPTAKSWAAASGLWQFIPGTGTRYGLRINGYVDERNSFEKATRASAQYLKFLAARYGGNWELGLAGYNCGEGNVDRAIRRAGVADFWAAYPYLPKETRDYVPNILATILIANNPNAYGFGHVRPAAPLQYQTVRVPPSTSLATVASLSDTTVDHIRWLNPEFRSNVTPPEPYIVRVPMGRGDNVAAVLRKSSVVNGNNVAVRTVVKGETAQQLANRTGMSQEALIAANGGSIPTNGKVVVPTNQKLVKPTYSSRPAGGPTPSPAAAKGIQNVVVKQGDTVAKIAARFGVPAVEVARLNGLSSVNAPLTAGRTIRVQPR